MVVLKNKRGYVLTWDALLSLVIIFISIFLFLTLGYLGGEGAVSFSDKPTFERIYLIGSNALDILDKNGALDVIITEWAFNRTDNSTKIADKYLDALGLIPGNRPVIGYRLEINGENVSERLGINGLTLNDAETKVTISRIFSLFGKNETSNVFVGRAWLVYNDSSRNKTTTIESVLYGNSSLSAIGGNWTFDYEGTPGTVYGLCIPKNCSGGNDKHNFTTSYWSYPNGSDAIDDAVYRLFDKLDTTNDGRIDIAYEKDNMSIEVASKNVKELGLKTTEVKLILWV